jgi:hypothetical protein
MTTITEEEAREILKDAELMINKYTPHLRLGQSFFNLLYAAFPKVADTIRGTKYDPFYDDAIIESCIQVITGNIPEPEQASKLLDDVYDLIDLGMSAFWDAINSKIYDDYPDATEKDRDEAYEAIGQRLKEHL